MIDIYKKKPESLLNKNISILGMGVSGIGAAKLLKFLGAKIFISDNNPIKEKLNFEEISNLEIDYEIGKHSDRIFNCELLVVSPGISKKNDVIKKALKLKIPIINDIELGSWYTTLPIVGITGSNGKTTTTKLLGSICTNTKFNAQIAGNIGLSFCEEVLKTLVKKNKKKVFILEISSFQTEFIIHFKPLISIFLNISPDHLDHHGSFNDYLNAKIRLSLNQDKNSYLIYNANDKIIKSAIINLPTNKIPFSLNQKLSYRYSLNETKLIKNNNDELITINKIKLIGKHNYLNIIAAATAAHLLGINDRKISDSIYNFKSIPHRLENFFLKNKIQYINDSKATNIDAVKSALNSFNKPIVLILGGYYKGGNFNELLPHAGEVKTIIVYGEAQEIIIAAFRDAVRLRRVDSLENAAILSIKIAKPGDIVLLSPGCASYDQFNSYEDRGNKFKECIINSNYGTS